VKGVSPKPFPARLIPFRTKGETPSRAAICREFINGADTVPGSLVVGVNCMGCSGEFEAMEWNGSSRFVVASEAGGVITRHGRNG
jgi:hypothetical protein